MAFRHPLMKVAELRQKTAQESRDALGRANAALSSAQTELALAKARLTAGRPAAQSVEELFLAEAADRAELRAVAAAHEAAKARAEQQARALADFTRARRQADAVEQLLTTRREEHAEEEARGERRTSDELARIVSRARASKLDPDAAR